MAAAATDTSTTFETFMNDVSGRHSSPTISTAMPTTDPPSSVSMERLSNITHVDNGQQQQQGKEEEEEGEAYKPKWKVNDAYDDGPDGGCLAWLVVLGAFLAHFTSFGTSLSWGIMQEYFERSVFYDVPDAQLQLTFAGTMMELMTVMLGPLYEIVSTRYGVRPVLILASFLGVVGLEMAAFATKIWHLYLTQGLLFGAGASLMYITAVSVPAQWFNRRRGLCLGIIASGSAVGGLVLPFVMTSLNNKLGGSWTYRILGFICLGMNIITSLLVKEKYPRHKKYKDKEEEHNDGVETQQNQQKKPRQPTLHEIFNFSSVLKDTNYLLWMVGSIIAYMGFYIPFFFLPSYARHMGFSSADGTVLIAIVSGSNCVGRVAVGYLGDHIGRLSANILFTLISGLSALIIWMFADSYNTLIAFAVVFGFVSSSYITLLSPITATILGIERFPTGLSLLLLSNSISVFSPSIASAIETQVVDNANVEPYLTYKVFSGVTSIFGALIWVILKIKMTRSLTAKL